jgi:hypothetical protein
MLEASFWTNVDGYLTHNSADARIPFYSAEEIRKWLEEEPSEAMIALGVNVPSPPYFIDSFKEREELIVTSIYKTLIAAKLEELK